MVLTYPLITLSTRSQVESKRAQSSVPDAIRRIIQREGISGLYAGLDSAVFGISVTNFVYYYCTPPSPTPQITISSLPPSNPVSTRVRMVSRRLRKGRPQIRSLSQQAHNPRSHGRWRPRRLRHRPHHQPHLGRQHPHDSTEARRPIHPLHHRSPNTAESQWRGPVAAEEAKHHWYDQGLV